MSDLLFSPLGPVLILLATGGALRLFPRSLRGGLNSLLLAASFGGTLLLLFRLRAAGAASLQATWQPLVAASLPVAWTVDGWNWLALLLLWFAGASVLLVWRPGGPRANAYLGLSLAVLSSAAITVVCDNLLALSAAWVAGDVLLIARARGSRATGEAIRASLVAGGSLLMLLAISITGLDIASAPLSRAPLPDETLILLLLVAALRMALYPLHLWVGPGNAVRDQGAQWLLSGVGLVTGGWLLGRIYPLGASYWLTYSLLPLLLVMSMLGAGLAAWTGRRADRIALVASNRAGWIWLILVLAPVDAAQAALGWALLAAVLGLMLFLVGEATIEHWGWRLPLGLSLLILAGTPLTAGMTALALSGRPGLLLWLAWLLADALALAAVFAGWHDPVGDPQRAGFVLVGGRLRQALPAVDRTMRRLLLAFAILAAPALLLGLRPSFLARLAGFSPAPGLGSLLAGLGLAGWLGLPLRLGLAILLARLLRQGIPAGNNLAAQRDRLAHWAGLTWILDAARWVLAWFDSGWRAILTILEGEGYAGWLILLILLGWLVIQG